MDKRFYLNNLLEKSPVIEDSEFHHLAHVMRIETGDEVELVDGQGTLARARIEKIEKKRAAVSIISHEKHPKPQPELIAAIPFLRMEKLDWVIEKATELGVDSIILFLAQLCEKKEIRSNQLDHLRQISIAAMKQCNRLYLPSISIFPSLERVLESSATILYGDVDPHAVPLIAVPVSGPILFITGPEKGFSASENKLLEHKAKGVRLHRNILRAETAPIVALTLLGREY